MHQTLLDLGMDRTWSDTGVYFHYDKKQVLVIILYVDDILFMGSDKNIVMHMKKSFMKLWDCRDLGPVKEYLGMKIVRDRKNRRLYIDQNAYALKVVNRFGMCNTKSTHVVLPTGYSQVNEGQCTPE